MMSFSQLMVLAPAIIVAIALIAAMLSISVKRSHLTTAVITVIGLNVALAYTLYQTAGFIFQMQNGAAPGLSIGITDLFVVDGMALFAMILILISALAVTLLCYYYIKTFNENKEELYLLLMLSTIGALLLVCSSHMTSFFVSLELLSVPLYGMIAYTHERSKSLEASLKYLVLSATASAAILMGLAFIYAFSGSMSFSGLSAMILTAPSNSFLVLGGILFLFGVAFKLSLVPFHAWTPDVYQGSPMPVTAFLATVSKVAVLVVVLRFFQSSSLWLSNGFITVLTVLAAASVLVGNLLALKQSNLKRLMGYSSIAHFGYALIAIVTLGPSATSTVNLYLAFYILTSIGAFGVLTLMSVPYRQDLDASNMSEYRGLFWRRPVLAAVLTVMMLSFAGIPMTLGFIGKFYVVLASVLAMNFLLATVVVIGSGIGLYYYLRVMVVLYMTPPEKPNFDAQVGWEYQLGGLMVLATALLVLIFGIYPAPIMALAGILV